MSRATGKFAVTGGSEQTVRETPGEVKLTRVSGTQRFDGGIVGEGSVEWVFCYRPDGSAVFAGFQRIEGSIDGRSGSLVLESTGDHDGRRSKGHWRVIPGSGAGELAGIGGEGSFEAPGGPQVTYELRATPVDAGEVACRASLARQLTVGSHGRTIQRLIGVPAVTRYPTASARQRVRKMSVSLPPDLAAFLKGRAGERGTAVSAELAEIVARERAADVQRRLDQALALDADDNRRFARETSLAVREAFGEPEW